MTTQRLFTHLLAIFVITVWGVTFVSTKLLLEAGFNPASILFYRFALAYIGIWIVAHRLPLCQEPQGRVVLCPHGGIWRIYVLLYGELGLGIYLDQQCLPHRMYESAANCYHCTFSL